MEYKEHHFVHIRDILTKPHRYLEASYFITFGSRLADTGSGVKSDPCKRHH